MNMELWTKSEWYGIDRDEKVFVHPFYEINQEVVLVSDFFYNYLI